MDLVQQESKDYKNMEKLQISYYECQCECSDHTIRFVYDPDENDLYTEVQLCQDHNVFERIWLALKYIFGYECKYGHWDCTLLKPEDCKEIKELLDKVDRGNKKEN